MLPTWAPPRSHHRGLTRTRRWHTPLFAVILFAAAAALTPMFHDATHYHDRALAVVPARAPVSAVHAGRVFGQPFGTPLYYPTVTDDTFFNTVGRSGDVIATANDSTGVRLSCTHPTSDIAILRASGASPNHLTFSTVNCMHSYGPRGGGRSPDGCSWKTGGITRVGNVIYLAVARQLGACSLGKETNGIQPSFDATIIKSTDGGRTWTNPWGVTSRNGAAPPWNRRAHRYRAMFPGRAFSAPFFIQYGPGNTHTHDGAGKYLYAVSTDGYAYNGNYLRLGRVPLGQVQDAKAWTFYHGRVGGTGQTWTRSLHGATRILVAEHGISQPAIEYVPAAKRYVLMTSVFTRARSNFPVRTETPYTQLRIYTARKPWGPWTMIFDHTGRRSLWCTGAPCRLTEQPRQRQLQIGTPHDWLGLYDPALVQKFLDTRSLTSQAFLTSGDWKNAHRYAHERLNRLLVVPFDLADVLRP